MQPYEEFAGSTFLITGGTGFLGRATVSALAKFLPETASVVVLTRSALQPYSSKNFRQINADIRRVSDYREYLLQAEHIIWMAASRDHQADLGELWTVNVGSIQQAIRELLKNRRLKRVLYISSISAVDHRTLPYGPITDDSIPCPQTPYGNSKLLAEKMLLNSGLPVTILRLPFLYGPGFASGSYLDWYRSVATGVWPSALRYTANLSLLCTRDFASLALQVLSKANRMAADDSPYTVSDGLTYCVDDLITLAGEIHGQRRPCLRLPQGVSALIYRLLYFSRFQYWRHAAFSKQFFVVDSTRFQKHFPLARYTPLAIGLRASYGKEIDSENDPAPHS